MTPISIHPDTTLGYVHLTVSSLDRSVEFYEQRLGFVLRQRQNGVAHLGAGRDDILVLTEEPGAQPSPRSTGLYHFAVLVPSRLALAHALQRLVATRTPLQGFADHWVSEAIYLADPDGNGIEIYRDRPRSDWPFKDGQLQMATEALDIDGVMAELVGQPEPMDRLHPDTVLGHMHLQVADISASTAFYTDVLGFDLMLYYGSSAGFVSAGGYHHHIGFNTWHTRGASPPPSGATGLREFVVRLPYTAALDAVLDSVHAAGWASEETADGYRILDPSQNAVLLMASQ